MKTGWICFVQNIGLLNVIKILIVSQHTRGKVKNYQLSSQGGVRWLQRGFNDICCKISLKVQLAKIPRLIRLVYLKDLCHHAVLEKDVATDTNILVMEYVSE